MRIDVDDRERATDAREHCGERAAASDHQHALGARLPDETEDRVDVTDKADAVLVRLALEAVALDIEQRARGFRFRIVMAPKRDLRSATVIMMISLGALSIGRRMARAVWPEMSKEMLIHVAGRGD